MLKSQLYINGKDAWETWGAAMGEGFLESLLTPAPAKEYVSNKSRSENGKQVYYNNPKTDEREIQLTITIQGKTQIEYLTRYKDFLQEISNGLVLFSIPVLQKTYRLYYTSSPTKMGNYGLEFGKFVFEFCEPNPVDREYMNEGM